MAGLTLDAGALIAYEHGQKNIHKILAVGYERGFVPTVPAIAQGSAGRCSNSYLVWKRISDLYAQRFD